MDLHSRAPDPTLGQASRTAIGVRIESDPAEPLHMGDVVLAIAGVPTAGRPLEQVEQLGLAAAEGGTVLAVVLRSREQHFLVKIGGAAEDLHPAGPSDGELPEERIRQLGDALVVDIHDIKDDLGDELSQGSTPRRSTRARPLRGVVLLLRWRKWGSTEGAIAALCSVCSSPGPPLFPMKPSRRGSIETDRAPEPPSLERWAEPLAASRWTATREAQQE